VPTPARADTADAAKPPGAPRRWARTDATQQRILDAATTVFSARGFTAATMADIVAASGASIGSIYHHFGGKKELFLAIFERIANDIERRMDAAAPRATGSDKRRVFEVTARAYLQAMWANRRAAMVLASGDVPAGFDRIRRNSMLTNFRRWISVLELDNSPRSQLLTRILVATMAESALMVAACDDAADAEPIIDATIESIDRLTG
jgi:AcrR family transcriptional regulator